MIHTQLTLFINNLKTHNYEQNSKDDSSDCRLHYQRTIRCLWRICDDERYASALHLPHTFQTIHIVYGVWFDFVTLFEPNATSVEKHGYGYIVAYIGELGGSVPYTAYNAKKSYIEANPDVIHKFTKAIDKGLKYVYSHDAKDIAKIMLDYFPDTTLADMETIVTRYKKGEAWKKNITVSEAEWQHIQEIIKSAGELDKYAPYDKLIYSKYFDDYE